ADAEDAAQDAFVRAWEKLASFREEASFKTWLLSIAWRQALNRRRSRARWWQRSVGGNADGTEEDVADGRTTPEQAAADEELRREIRRAINRLTPKLRDTFLLTRTGAHSYDEISAMLKIPIGTIKWRVSEARRVIKKYLSERGYGEV